MNILLHLLLLFAVPVAAYADTFPVPEPDTLSLFGIGAVAVVLSTWRRKN